MVALARDRDYRTHAAALVEAARRSSSAEAFAADYDAILGRIVDTFEGQHTGFMWDDPRFMPWIREKLRYDSSGPPGHTVPVWTGRGPWTRGAFDPRRKPGERMISITTPAGPPGPDRGYQVVVADFLAWGGDGFTEFAAGDRLDEGGLDGFQAGPGEDRPEAGSGKCPSILFPELAGIFAIDVCGYAILDNHLHLLVQLDEGAPCDPTEHTLQLAIQAMFDVASIRGRLRRLTGAGR